MEPVLEMQDLQVIRAIAEEGGVGLAARRLHLSQSAISHRLARLQQRLGVQLFRRRGRALVLTDAGRDAVAIAGDILDRLADAEGRLRGEGCRRQLRLSTQCYTAYHWLPAVVRRLAEVVADVDIELVLDATRSPMAALEEGRLDVALCHTVEVGARYELSPLFRDEFVLIVGSAHPLGHRRRVDVADLDGHTMFGYELPRDELRRIAKAFFGNRPPKVVSRFVPLTEAIVEFVRAGDGVALLPRWIVAPHLDANLAIVDLRGTNRWREWKAVYPKDTPLRDAIDVLVDRLRGEGRPMAERSPVPASETRSHAKRGRPSPARP